MERGMDLFLLSILFALCDRALMFERGSKKTMEKENPFDTEVSEYEEWFETNDQVFASELEAVRQSMPKDALGIEASMEEGIEIGVGTGIFASRLGIPHGVESSKNMADEARKKGIHVMNGAAEELPVEDRAYPLALMVTVDCFLKDVSKAFFEVNRILIEEGIFVIAFLDKATPLGAIYEQNKQQHKSYRDANFHSAQEMKEMLEAAGFEILEMRQTIYTLENTHQDTKKGTGEGVFAVFQAKKRK
jgi:ubiquinone/menaquinone biosynthesis C-methylase UbiE